MSKQTDEEFPIQIRIPIPLSLRTRFIDAIIPRVHSLLRANHSRQGEVVSDAEDMRAWKQAKTEALQEAIEDWLAKPKDEKWR